MIGILSNRQEVRWTKIIPPHLRPYVISKGNDKLKFLMNIALFFTLGFGVLALSGPAWKKVEVPGQELETPMVIILDLSQSMMATDLQPNRLERAKFKIHDLLKEDPQARAALIVYAGTAHTVVPLTKDYQIILSHIEGLSPSIMPLPGSNLEAALVLADTVTGVTTAPGTVIIFSDDYEDGQMEILQQFTESSGHRVILVPVNTPQGGEVPDISGTGSIRDAEGNTVYSSLDEDVLSRLSSLDRVQVQRLTLDNSDMELISTGISQNLIFKTRPEEKKDDWRDAGLLLVIPMALLLLFWFRKGWVVYVIPLLIMTSCSGETEFADLWFTGDYQGQRLMNRGDYAGSAQQFTDPLRKGVAFFKAGDFEGAIEAFRQDTSAMGAYNLGLAYFNNGDTVAAMSAFGYAAELDPDFTPAREAQEQLGMLKGGESEVSPEDAQEAGPQGQAENIENTSPEDLSGGGQEATAEDMEKERQEETVSTDVRKGKEMEEVPEDMEAGAQQQDNSKILMRSVDDDPALFLKRKFEFQVKKGNLKTETDGKSW
jgi:Ca-activated chloride channel family protein